MVCRPCKEAGQLAGAAVAVKDALYADAQTWHRDVLVKEIKALHAQCPGGTWCDCQHRLPAKIYDPALAASSPNR